MKVEYSENERRPIKKKRKKHSKLKGIIIAVASILSVLGVTVVLMFTVFFKVSSVKVIGSSIYSSDEIIYASGIMTGDNILSMSSDDIEARIVEALPYISTAEIVKSLPDTVGIKVTPNEEKVTVLTDIANYVTDKNYKVLRTVAEADESLVRIRGISAKEFTVGKEIVFEDPQQQDIIKNIVSICEEKALNVTYINISNLVDISFAVDNSLLVKLGSYSEMGQKIAHLKAMYPSIDTNVPASVSLKDYTITNKEAILKYEEIADFIK